MLDYEKMRPRFLEFDMTLSRHQFNLFDIYASFLVEYNEKVNLTAIKTPREIAVKHFLDSVIPLEYIEMHDGITIADIGTGAGFPGLPMLIMHPTAKLTLIESNGKRVTFLSELIGKLNAYAVENDLSPLSVEIVQSRSEDCARGEIPVQSTEYRIQNTDIASDDKKNPVQRQSTEYRIQNTDIASDDKKNPVQRQSTEYRIQNTDMASDDKKNPVQRQSTEYRIQNTDMASDDKKNPVQSTVKKRVLRESFDIATARAVAPLSQLAEYCMPFVKVGGIFLALKGTSEDYESGASAVEELGGDLEDYVEYTLPTGEGRRVFVIEKNSPTPKKYPRANTMIKKKRL
jgi:16S rRNA G527 N7-methylase RsmG